MKLTSLLQEYAPQKLLSRLVLAATRWRVRPWKNFLIRVITRVYKVDIGEAQSASLADYPNFNAFFTRALRLGARPVDPDPRAVLMPADGRISQLGPITNGSIFQAKGHQFSCAELLADSALAAPFHEGVFATVYLSPRDYHRVHMPLAGRLLETLHVPGRLYSVSPGTVAEVARLFARNERLVCMFETGHGPLAVVLVGAMLVSGVETVWAGVEIPPYAKTIVRREFKNSRPQVELGRLAELGRFNMGSTVILLMPKGFSLDLTLAAGMPVRVGQRLGSVPAC